MKIVSIPASDETIGGAVPRLRISITVLYLVFVKVPELIQSNTLLHKLRYKFFQCLRIQIENEPNRMMLYNVLLLA